MSFKKINPIISLFFISIGCNFQPNQQQLDGNRNVDTLTFDQYLDGDKESYNLINNENIRYAIVLRLDTTTAPFSSNYRVRLENITDTEKEKLKEIPSEMWLQLLEDDNTDWAANLILYDIYENDASILSKIENREWWFKLMKQNDIDYWKKVLNEKR